MAASVQWIESNGACSVCCACLYVRCWSLLLLLAGFCAACALCVRTDNLLLAIFDSVLSPFGLLSPLPLELATGAFWPSSCTKTHTGDSSSGERQRTESPVRSMLARSPGASPCMLL